MNANVIKKDNVFAIGTVLAAVAVVLTALTGIFQERLENNINDKFERKTIINGGK